MAQFNKLTTANAYHAPVTFRIVCQNDGRDFRVGYAASQFIFNWEMRPDELRVDGGPANGRHMPGCGRLPPGQWVGIGMVFESNEMRIYVNGQQRCRVRGNFAA